MKHKTATLAGALLDAAVAKAEGRNAAEYQRLVNHCEIAGGTKWSPSTDWQYGGPIIERERIMLACAPDITQDAAKAGTLWRATIGYWDAAAGATQCDGRTPMIAAMRAYVSSKLGEEVELL